MKKLFLILLCLISTCPLNASPLSSNTSSPIDITSNNLEVDDANNIATFTGNVKVLQGSTKIDSEKMFVHFRQDKEKKSKSVYLIKFTGGVLLKNENDETASGKYGNYNLDNNTITIFENVILTQDKNILQGDKLIYDLVNGKTKITSNKNEENKDTRVKVILNN